MNAADPDMLGALEHGPAYAFATWPAHDHLDGVGTAVYTIWEGATLLYAGMSGVLAAVGSDPRRDGPSMALRKRLDSHLRDDSYSDRFRMYLVDFVASRLTPKQLAMLNSGKVRLSGLMSKFVREQLTYRFVAASDTGLALSLEMEVRRGGLSVGRPQLNPNYGAGQVGRVDAEQVPPDGSDEIWKPIPSAEGRYKASNLGRVRSLFVSRNNRASVPAILRPSLNTCGYWIVGLRIDGKRSCRLVHNLVLEAFAGLRPDRSWQGCHLNGDKNNNRLENLKWCTPEENGAHRRIHGTSLLRPWKTGDDGTVRYQCRRCGEWKEADSGFHRLASKASACGLFSECKRCVNQARTERRRNGRP